MHYDIKTKLSLYIDPYLKQDLFSSNCIKKIEIEGNIIELVVMLPYPIGKIQQKIKNNLIEAFQKLIPDYQFNIQVFFEIKSCTQTQLIPHINNIKNIVAIASGKGGVGKSTTAVNLAIALSQDGAKVGILDADIYGPSIGLMLGVDDDVRPKQKDGFFEPIKKYGIYAMSMAFLVTEKTPMVWRGPMVSGALLQLLTQTAWPELDFLIIDMPPGTGDICLTLAQKIPVTGSLIVTTPQDLSLIDAIKAVEMFHKVDIAILGLVENMSIYTCKNCGHTENLFGEGAGIKLSENYNVDILGKLPLMKEIREYTDKGYPAVMANSCLQISNIYHDIARKMSASLYLQKDHDSSSLDICITDD